MLVFGCDELNVLQIGGVSGFLIFHSQAKAEAHLKITNLFTYEKNSTEGAEHLIRGAFNDYLDTILPFFDHHLPLRGHF